MEEMWLEKDSEESNEIPSEDTELDKGIDRDFIWSMIEERGEALDNSMEFVLEVLRESELLENQFTISDMQFFKAERWGEGSVLGANDKYIWRSSAYKW